MLKVDFVIGPSNLLFAGVCVCALFSPEILGAGAVKGLIADSDGKPKEKNEETENRRGAPCRHLHAFLLACSQDVMRIKTARNLYIKQLKKEIFFYIYIIFIICFQG